MELSRNIWFNLLGRQHQKNEKTDFKNQGRIYVARRWCAPSNILTVGTGIPDGPAWGCGVTLFHASLFTITLTKRPAAPPPLGGGGAGLGFAPGWAPCGWGLWGGGGFGPLRGGVGFPLFPPSSFHVSLNKRPAPPPPLGGGAGGLWLRQGLRHLRMALWDDGGFRPLRRAVKL